MPLSLRPVISVDPEKCVNCHKCVSVCPIKMCNDGSGSYVQINHDLCLGCGACIKACTHDARSGIDDMNDFLSSLGRGDDIVAVAAPAVAAGFDWLRFNAFLISMGVKAVFDVSFGAELTVKSYIHHIKTNNPPLVIAQPCPALVTYLELRHPELLEHLAPADSPMMHTMKFIRNTYPQYRHAKFLIVSPCYAKRREFDEVGIGDFNVTLRSFDKLIQNNGIDLYSLQPRDFDGPSAERGVLFSSPGGLMRTAEREVPGISNVTRKIEGQPGVYEYLDGLNDVLAEGNTRYRLVDCLNCDHGCNGGAGTCTYDMHIDLLESRIEKRSDQMIEKQLKNHRFSSAKKAQKKYSKMLDSFWKPSLFDRTYVDRSSNYSDTIKTPKESDITAIYRSMHKNSERDILNCGACGYDTCREMAYAIYNGKNRPENCRHYMSQEISLVVRQMIDNIENIRAVLDKSTSSFLELENASRGGNRGMHSVVENISKMELYSQTLARTNEVIQDISSKTNMLAINASIEAAHAGESGRGFSVVASEIKKLAENTQKQVQSIAADVSNVKSLIKTAAASTSETQNMFDKTFELAEAVKHHEDDIKTTIDEQHREAQAMLAKVLRE